MMVKAVRGSYCKEAREQESVPGIAWLLPLRQSQLCHLQLPTAGLAFTTIHQPGCHCPHPCSACNTTQLLQCCRRCIGTFPIHSQYTPSSDTPLEASLIMTLVHHNHLMAVTQGVLGTGLPGTLKIFLPSALLYFSPQVFCCPAIVCCENTQ